jgi:O-antigen ligase
MSGSAGFPRAEGRANRGDWRLPPGFDRHDGGGANLTAFRSEPESNVLPYRPIDCGRGCRTTFLRGSVMPLTGLLVFVYVVSLVLFAESSSTHVLAYLAGLALAVAFVVESVTRRTSLGFPAPLLWAVAFVCFCTFQMIWTPASAQSLLTLVQLLVLAVIIVNYGASDSGRPSVEYGLYFAMLMTFVYNIAGAPQAEPGGRIGSTLLNANAYAFMLLLGALFALRRIFVGGVGRTLRLRTLLCLLAYIGLSWYGIIVLTVSRKGIIVGLAATAILAIYWVWQQPIHRRMLFSALLVAFFALLGYGLYNLPQFSRVAELSQFLGGSGNDVDLAFRNSQLKTAMRVWLEHPFVGVGLDQFRLVSGGSMQSYSFNNYTELLANHGIVGTLLYLMIYVSSLGSLVRSLFRSRDRVLSANIVWALVVVGVLAVWDIGAVSYLDKGTWLTIGVAVAVSRRAGMKTRTMPSGLVPHPM